MKANPEISKFRVHRGPLLVSTWRKVEPLRASA